MKFKNYLFIVVISVVLSSCLVEQRIAYRYQVEIHDTPILFHNSAEVYLTNSKGEFPYNISPDAINYNLDSSFYESDLVQYIDVYDFKNNFGDYLKNQLQTYKLNIYSSDSITSFIKQSEPRMIVDIKQIEIEEYYDIFLDETTDMPISFNSTNRYLHIKEAEMNIEYGDDGLDYYKSSIQIPRTAIILNLWLQIDVWLKDSVHKSSTVFMDYVISDDIEGTFIIKNYNKPQYIYSIDSLETYDLWKVKELPAKAFAENIVDFLVNSVVENRLRIMSNVAPHNNYKYKKSSGLIIPNTEKITYLILNEEN